MNAFYRIGLSIVLVTVLFSSVLCVLLVNPRPDSGPAGEHLESLNRELGHFRLTERSGRELTNAELARHVWIAAFVFSRCNASCPVISKKMKDIQADLSDTNVVLASITVDPDFDTPTILQEFAKRYSAHPDRWLYLTGLKNELYNLILEKFQIDVAEISPADRKEGAEAVAHSDRLVLIGPGNRLLGAYDSKDPQALQRLESLARRLDRHKAAERMGWVLKLPAINASFNATCSILLLVGWLLIRSGCRRMHAACMITAILVSSVFLACYLVYHYFVGSVPFSGKGPTRIVYLSILLSHTLLAVAVVPLITLTLIHALRGRFTAHASVARVTFPIWLYVSITGVVVYWMLYQLPPAIPFSA